MTDSQPVTAYLQRPDGRIAYDVIGDGPLVVCAPGMGELRSSFRHLVPGLVAGGFRVATMDLRGHGDSDATFSRYDDGALASDIRALIEELGGPAALVGSSMSAAAGVLAETDHRKLFWGLVLVGPFVRDPQRTALQKFLQNAAISGPWASRAWLTYYPKFVPGQRPDDYDEHVAQIAAALKRKGHRHAFVRTTRASHAPTEAVLDNVRTPTLVVMGAADPDFPDPNAEAHMIARRVSGRAELIEGAGHYPHDQAADQVTPLVVAFLHSVTPNV